MRLSTKGRYAVMAMTDLARAGAGAAVSLAEIAERQEISLAYLEQLFVRLRRAESWSRCAGPAAATGWRGRRDRSASPRSWRRSTSRWRATRCAGAQRRHGLHPASSGA